MGKILYNHLKVVFTQFLRPLNQADDPEVSESKQKYDSNVIIEMLIIMIFLVSWD